MTNGLVAAEGFFEVVDEFGGARELRRSMATVMGPTPPGTGVMCDAILETFSKSTSPTVLSLTRLMPTSMTTGRV